MVGKGSDELAPQRGSGDVWAMSLATISPSSEADVPEHIEFGNFPDMHVCFWDTSTVTFLFASRACDTVETRLVYSSERHA